MVNQSQEPPTDAEIDGESNDPGPADPPRPGLILLAADDTVVCIDDACLPGDVQG